MIEVLSSPVGVNFTTVDGVQPYNHKYTTPINKIEYINTVYNTPIRGIDAIWAQQKSDGGWANSFVGRVPMMKFYVGEGVPEPLVNYDPSRKWRVRYVGYVIPRVSETYNFYFNGEGSAIISGAAVGGASSFPLSMDSKESATFSESLTAGVNYLLDVYFYANSRYEDCGFIGMWDTDSASFTPEKQVISGSLCRAVTDSSLPTAESVLYYGKTNYKETETNSIFTFEVPFVSSVDSYSYRGYYYSTAEDAYIEVETSQKLQQYRQIRYSEGYRNSDDEDEYVAKFTGQIRDFKTKYNKDGADSIVVTCQDYSIFTRDAINLRTPTPIDYHQAGYVSHLPGKANGEIKPQTLKKI